MPVTSVNLLWQRRFRGLLPAGSNAASDAGAALLIKPDDFEPRTYQVLSLDADAKHRELQVISVETTQKFDGLPDGSFVLGATNDDLYLFRDGKKTRFAPDRSANYSDFALAAEAGYFVVGFSNSVYSSHGLIYGDSNGRVGWNKDIPALVNRTAITRDGRFIAAGLQSGRVLAFDNMRSPVWECVQEEPITALAMGARAPVALAGTQLGHVIAIDNDGGFRWKEPVGLPVVGVATDGACEWAVAVASDTGMHRLIAFGPEGDHIWEHELDATPTGVALSPNGQYLLVTGVGGLAWFFEMDFALAAGTALGCRRERELGLAREAVAAGDPGAAVVRLRALLDRRPHDLDLAEEVDAVERAWVAEACRQAQSLCEEGSPSDAVEALTRVRAACPFDERILPALRSALEAAGARLSARADELVAAGDWDPAAAAVLEWLRLDPTRLEARRRLLEVRQAQVRELTEEGDRLRADGNLESAVALWQEAQNLLECEELSIRLRAAEIERCLAAGVAHYEAQHHPEAQFQFRKVLALDPGNETARRYLGYTTSMTGDTGIQDRFARLDT